MCLCIYGCLFCDGCCKLGGVGDAEQGLEGFREGLKELKGGRGRRRISEATITPNSNRLSVLIQNSAMEITSFI